MSSRIKSVWLDVFPYYKNSAYPLCVISRFRRRGERLIYPDVEINFGKGVEAKWCNEVREVPFVCSLPLEDSEQQFCDECRPYLYFHGIRRCAYIQEKGWDSYLPILCSGVRKNLWNEWNEYDNPILVLIFKGTVGAVPKMIKHQGRAYHTSIHRFYFCL